MVTVNQLPTIRGRYTQNADLSKYTWFQVGGPADVLFKPADSEDLQHFLRNTPSQIPVFVLGVGSNLIIRDGGIRGVVIRMGRAFTHITVDGQRITAGAGALDQNVAQVAAQHGLGGLEFLSGIPGTVGAAIRMNAGAYGSETKNILQSVKAIDRAGNLHQVTGDELGLTYRNCSAPNDWIFTEATFKATPEADPSIIHQRMAEIREKREASQPIRGKTGGSTFKNPEGHSAWKLVDEAGCRGLVKGGAMISEKHTNFMLNVEGATAKDLEDLGDEVIQKVKENSGIKLEWEIKHVGDKA